MDDVHGGVMAVLTELLTQRTQPEEDQDWSLLREILADLARWPAASIVQLVSVNTRLLERLSVHEGCDPTEILREAWVTQ